MNGRQSPSGHGSSAASLATAALAAWLARLVTPERPALALVGFVWVLVAYVGTSFLFGRSSHAF